VLILRTCPIKSVAPLYITFYSGTLEHHDGLDANLQVYCVAQYSIQPWASTSASAGALAAEEGRKRRAGRAESLIEMHD
jgi:hypothetical protein